MTRTQTPTTQPVGGGGSVGIQPTNKGAVLGNQLSDFVGAFGQPVVNRSDDIRFNAVGYTIDIPNQNSRVTSLSITKKLGLPDWDPLKRGRVCGEFFPHVTVEFDRYSQGNYYYRTQIGTVVFTPLYNRCKLKLI